MKLYELPASFAEAEALCNEDGELTPEAFIRLSELEMALEAKVEACCRVLRNYEAKAAAFRAEAERLHHHQAIADANAKRIKEYIKANLEKLGVAKLDAGLFQVRVQMNPVSVQVEESVNLEALPDEFKTTTVTVNRKAILDAAKGGAELPAGCSLYRGTHLRVS